jgi:hypothetical protein
MRYLAFVPCLGLLLACQDSPPEPKQLAVVSDDAGPSDAAEIVAERMDDFDCDLSEAPDGMEPVAFEGSSTDVLLVQETSPCALSIVHRRTDGTLPDTALFTGAFSFGEIGRLSAGTLVACTSQVQLSDPIGGDSSTSNHKIANVSLECAAHSGSGWSPTAKVAGPSGSEWAAWGHAITPLATPGQFEVTWVRDFTLFPLTLVDEGRPPEDGVYKTQISASSSGITVGATTKLSNSVLSLNTEPGYVLPDGTEVPFGETYTFEPEPSETCTTCTAPQYPGQSQFDGTPIGTGIGWSYNMGHRFTPNAAGGVTALGGYYSGTKTVRLYDYATGAVLGSAAHTSANAFSYTTVEPIDLAAGSTYVVAAYMNGSGAAYDGPYATGATYEDITIDCPGTYLYNSTGMPTNCTTYYYGMADLEFQKSAGSFCGDGTCSGGEDCASCAVDCGACAPPQHPGQSQFDGTPLGTGIGWNYNMGHRFTPNVSGAITGLGGYYSGTKTVRLYDYATAAVLGSAAHTSSNAFGYTAVSPIAVSAGSTYVVAADIDGSGGAYDGPYTAGATYGDVTINCPGTYLYNSTAMPTNCTTYYYGMADVELQK